MWNKLSTRVVSAISGNGKSVVMITQGVNIIKTFVVTDDMDKKARVFVHGRFFGVSLCFLPLSELTVVHSVGMLPANTLVWDKLFFSNS